MLRELKRSRCARRDAKPYGATSVLLVPAVVKKDVSYADAYTLAGGDSQGAAASTGAERQDRAGKRLEQLSVEPVGNGSLRR